MTVLGIDPGNVASGYALIDADDRRPLQVGKVPNPDLLAVLTIRQLDPTAAAVEMIASYGMTVGREVFDTCVWIGRFYERISTFNRHLVYRRDVKLHHCRSSKATDANVTQALVDRFTPGARNFGKGTKDAPGWFHGFAGDMWQAYALAVLRADQLDGYQP